MSQRVRARGEARMFLDRVLGSRRRQGTGLSGGRETFQTGPRRGRFGLGAMLEAAFLPLRGYRFAGLPSAYH